jgi:hypothetical protein
MFRSHFFTLFVLSLLVMGQAVTTRAADSPASSYPEWAAAAVPAYPHLLPLERPCHPEDVCDRNHRSHANGGGVVQVPRARRMVGKRRRKYLVCKEPRCMDPNISELLRRIGRGEARDTRRYHEISLTGACPITTNPLAQ